MDSGTIVAVVIIVAIAIDVTARILALIFVPKNRRPQTALAW